MLAAFWHTTASVHLPTLLPDTDLILVTSLGKCYCISTLHLLMSSPSISLQQPEGFQWNIQQITSLLSLNITWFYLHRGYTLTFYHDTTFSTKLKPHCISLYSDNLASLFLISGAFKPLNLFTWEAALPTYCRNNSISRSQFEWYFLKETLLEIFI